MPTRFLAVLLTFCAVSFGGEARAQVTDTWIGGSGKWSVMGNWSTQNLPMPGQNCSIPGGSVVSDDAGGTCLNLTLGGAGTLTITPGYLELSGTSLSNNGTISIGVGNGLTVEGDTTVTLSGAGTLTMISPNARLGGANGAAGFVNHQTIQGIGEIGFGTLAITNQSTINASGGMLSVQPSVPAGIVNTGLMEASSGSTLEIIYGLQGPFNNTGGIIQALDGGTVVLSSGTYTGGALKTFGSGMFTTPPGGSNPILNNLTNQALINIPAGGAATIEGTITNNAIIQVPGELFVSGAATLQGAGSILLQGGSMAQLNGTDSLTNEELIHGYGTIFQLPLTNKHTIQADNTSMPLSLSGGTTTNTATMQASGGGTLQISNTIKNTGGIIQALAGSTVNLAGTVSGGTLVTVGTGTIQSQNGTLDGTVNIPTNTGTLIVKNFDLFLQGTVSNKGTISLASNFCVILNKPSTLTGSGKLTMTPNSCIFGSGNAFTNQSTIAGAGSIGDSNPMPIINNGTIIANQASPLTIVPDASGFTNNGKLTVNTGSTLNINGLFKNLSSMGMLTSGTYFVGGTLGFENSVVSNNAQITLIDASARILNNSTSTNALAGLASNTTVGSLALLSGQMLTTTTNFTNAGKATVGIGSSLTIGGSYTQTAGTTTVDGTLTAHTGLAIEGGLLEGKGTLGASVICGATAIAGDSTGQAGQLTILGSYLQKSTGILDIAIGGTTVGTQYSRLSVSHGASLGGTLNIKRINGFLPNIGEVFTILTSIAVSGKFSTVNGLSINSSEHFAINYGSKAVTLTVVAGS